MIDDEWILLVQIAQDFFAFARDASASARAAGVASLICDYLHMDLTSAERAEVESILTVMLDDPSPLVRRAIAEGLAHEVGAPRHIIHAFAHEQSEHAAIVLQHSPLFHEAELADLALAAPVGAQMAIARRAFVHANVAMALVEMGPPCVLVELARNDKADVSEQIMLRMMMRAGHDGRLREALLLRPETPRSVRLYIAEAVSADLGVFLKQTGWLSPERSERVLRDAREKLVMAINAQEAQAEQGGAAGATLSLVRHLRGQGQLTAALLLRSLVCGDCLLLAAALADLSQRLVARVLPHVQDAESAAFAALYAKANLPAALQPVFRAVLVAQAQTSRVSKDAPDLSLVRVARQAADHLPEEPRGRLLALLGRLETEAARAALHIHMNLPEASEDEPLSSRESVSLPNVSPTLT